MSKTFPARPVRTQRPAARANPAAGRGRGQQMAGQQEQPNLDIVGHGQQEPAEDPRAPQNRGAYTVFAPDQKKREKITTGAQAAETRYNAHKQANTPKSFNIVATPGGGQLSMAEARQKQIQGGPSKVQSRAKAEHYREEKKLQEEQEFQKKKDSQRQKAMNNDQRTAAREKQLKENQRRTNEAFLSRIENKQRQQMASCAQQVVTLPVQNVSQQSSRTQPDRTATVNHERITQTTHNTSGRREMGGAAGADGTSDNLDDLRPSQRQSLSQLSEMFEEYSRDQLLVILQQVDFDLEQALDLLQ